MKEQVSAWAHHQLENTVADINIREAEITQDDRFKSTPAKAEVNAPLALIQVALETELQVIRRIRKSLLGGDPSA